MSKTDQMILVGTLAYLLGVGLPLICSGSLRMRYLREWSVAVVSGSAILTVLFVVCLAGGFSWRNAWEITASVAAVGAGCTYLVVARRIGMPRLYGLVLIADAFAFVAGAARFQGQINRAADLVCVLVGLAAACVGFAPLLRRRR